MLPKPTIVALVLGLGAVDYAIAQTVFTSVNRNTEMLSTAVAELRRTTPPAASQRATDSDPLTDNSFSRVNEDTTASAVVTNGSVGGTDFGHTIASTEQFSEIRDSGVALCAESRVFATIESNGPGVPQTLFATGEAHNLFKFTFRINSNTHYEISGELSSFPNLDVNDAEFELRGPLIPNRSPALIFGLGVAGNASRSFSKSGSLSAGTYTLEAESFSNLSGRGGEQPDTAGAEVELFLQLGNGPMAKNCGPPSLSGLLLLLL